MKLTNILIRILTVTAVIVAFLQLRLEAGTFVYEAVPFTLIDDNTGDEYAISGTFTTDCNDCSASLIAWDIEVSGNFPFTFTENNSFIFAQSDVIATPTELLINDDLGGLIIDDDPDPLGIAVIWQRSPSAGGDSHDVFYSRPNVTAIFTVPSTDDFIFATIIPEPSSALMLMMILGVASLPGVRRS